jgi:hypothetical protein
MTKPQCQVAALRTRIVSVTGAPEYSGFSAVSSHLSPASTNHVVAGLAHFMRLFNRTENVL